MKRLIAGGLAVILITVLTACGGGGINVAPVAPDQAEDTAQPGQGLASLPHDVLQPWEQLNTAGYVEPGSTGRGASALGEASDFTPGIERYLDGGTTVDNGEATRLSSSAAGLGFAIYRIPLGGGEPGVISVDANLTTGEGYFVGLSNYGDGSWEWYGPYADNHVRLPASSGDYTSELGITYIGLAVYAGAAADIIGIGVDPLDPADTTPPPIPTTPQLTPVAGGLLVEWVPVSAGDLAGYRVYHSTHDFTSGSDNGVSSGDSLEGLTSVFLPGAGVDTYVRVSAVDISGNESDLSELAVAAPLAAGTAVLTVTVSAPSGVIGDALELEATGFSSYDFDTDGDGLFEITGQAGGTAPVATSAPGIIRPRVRAYDGEGVMHAEGGVSVVISSNVRPVANATATPTMGTTPLTVSFSGTDSTDFDGSLVGGGWDFDGDGTYDIWDDTDIVHVTGASHEYTTSGVYNAKLRVLDDQGAWDVDTLVIIVSSDNLAPAADLTANVTAGDAPLAVSFHAGGSTDGDGTIIEYAWDCDGDGGYDTFTDSPDYTYTYQAAGIYSAKVRVEDDGGARDTATLDITVNVAGNDPPVAGLSVDPTYGDEGVLVTLDASGSSDSDGSIVQYEWDYDGDGQYDSYGSAATTNHTYQDSEIYTAKVRVTDDAGAQATATAGLRVNETFDNQHPWPSRGHDPRGTRRSPYIGAQSNNVKWIAYTGNFVQSNAAVAADGTIYFSSLNGNIHAVNPDGSRKWLFGTGSSCSSSPAIGADGAVYAGSWSNSLYAINPDGTQRWSYSTADKVTGSPAVAADGSIYFGSEDGLVYALNPDGSLQWNFITGDSIKSSPAIGTDGTIYIGSNDNSLYAINPDGTEQWSFPAGDNFLASPAIGPDGTIYIGNVDANLYALNPDGSVQWAIPTGDAIQGGAAIAADGTIYVGSNDTNLYAINPDGTPKWSFQTDDDLIGPPAIGADGSVYFGGVDGIFYALNADGSNKWDYSTGGSIQSSPAIGADGTVYIGSDNTAFYAFGATPGNLPPVADLQGSPINGWAPLETYFSAVDSYDPDGEIVDYQWDFDGDRVFGEPGDEAYFRNDPAPFVLYSPGIYPVTVLVTDNDGATATASLTVTCHGGISVSLDSGNDYYAISMALINGKPAVAYTGSGASSGIAYIRADSADGKSWASPVTVDFPGSSANCLLEVEGRPAVAYANSGGLQYKRANNAEGTSWGTAVGIAGGTNIPYSSMTLINGNPAIAWFNAGNLTLYYARATDATGSAWGTPVAVNNTGMAGSYCSLIEADGRPAIAYYNFDVGTLEYLRAMDANGGSWGTMAYTMDSAGDVGTHASMALVDGYPAVSYVDLTNERIKYVRASDAAGSTWGAPVIVQSVISQLKNTSLAVINGRPAISYVGWDTATTNVYLNKSSNTTGSSWATAEIVNSNVGYPSVSLIEVQDHAAIAFSEVFGLKFYRQY